MKAPFPWFGGKRRVADVVWAALGDDHLMPDTWRRHRWSGTKAYGTTRQAEAQDGNYANRHGETLWISPHCLGSHTPTLFDALEAS